MNEWHRQMQLIINEIDFAIKSQGDEGVTLKRLAKKLGYSEYYVSAQFRLLSGMPFRQYLKCRKLAFALQALKDTDDTILSIALNYGFSSNEAFSRAFKKLYGVSPAAYRRRPMPVSLYTVIKPFDMYLSEAGQMNTDVKTYFVTIPAHKYLHIRNYESIGYWDFWQKQSAIPGQDCETITNLLDQIPGQLDDAGGKGAGDYSGQIMGFINEPAGRICSWGIPLAESYGVRLPKDYSGPVPSQMQLMDVDEGEYLVFEHGPFDYETENAIVEEKIERTMQSFDYPASGYRLDLTPGRIFYFFHDCGRFWKYARPVVKA